MTRPSTTLKVAALSYTCIEPVGERCVLIRVGDHVNVATSRIVHAVTAYLTAKKLKGVIEIVPAFTTVAVHFQPTAFVPQRGLPTTQLTRLLEAALAEPLPPLPASDRVVEIPACYGGEFGPDLDEVAQRCGISVEEVIALHSGSTLTLYAFFFSPGNPFAGPVDPRLNIGRRSSPRTRVEAGSVAIANGISSIYQSASPGGWNVIARTPWNLFHVEREPPTRLQPGDLLRFKPITPEQFKEMLEPRP